MKTKNQLQAVINSATHLIYINACNTTSGNPRRGWIIMNGHLQVGFIDEGYRGYDAVPAQFQELPGFRSSYIMVHPSEYKAARKLPEVTPQP